MDSGFPSKDITVKNPDVFLRFLTLSKNWKNPSDFSSKKKTVQFLYIYFQFFQESFGKSSKREEEEVNLNLTKDMTKILC